MGNRFMRTVVAAALCGVVAACRPSSPVPPGPGPAPTPLPGNKTFTVSSAAFHDGDPIPRKFTCDGENISPQIAWGPTPAGTKSWALIVEDPDAPGGLWAHWVLFNLPAAVRELPEHEPAVVTLANGGGQGLNDFKKPGYGGPCPPSGTHRYVFRVFAVDTALTSGSVTNRQQLLAALQGHILAESDLAGKYSR